MGVWPLTCNQLGAINFMTEIGKDVFVSAVTQLVGPVKVSDNATIGAGSTITRDVN